MSRVVIAAKLVAVAAVAGHVSSAAASQIAANNMPLGYQSTGWNYSIAYSNPSIGYSNEAAGQRFVSQLSGPLVEIAATIDPFLTGSEPLQVELHLASGNLPGPLLAAIQVPPSQVNDFSHLPSRFDFSSQNVQLSAGTAYVVVFKANNPLFQSTRYRALLTQFNPSSFGTPALDSPDFGATWIENIVQPEIGLIVTVPEPAGWITSVIGGILIWIALARASQGRGVYAATGSWFVY